MPKVGMQPIRRKQLIDAAIASIHEYGLNKATVARIADKAGVSSGIVHHYFSDKDDLLFETMRSLLRELRIEAVERLSAADGPRERIYAIIDANFSESQCTEEVISAWLALYGSARRSERLSGIAQLYRRRLRSNLIHALKQLLPSDHASQAAEGTAAMIDGVWLHCALRGGFVNSQEPRTMTRQYVDHYLEMHGLNA